MCDLITSQAATSSDGVRTGVLHRPLLTQLLGGRYQVYSKAGRRVQLGEDVVRRRPVALKFGSKEEIQRESGVLDAVGPDVAPEVFETFYDERSDSHVLVMQAADPHAEMRVLRREDGKPLESLAVRHHALGGQVGAG